MDPVKDELLLTDDYEETDDDESDQTDDVSITDRHMQSMYILTYSQAELKEFWLICCLF